MFFDIHHQGTKKEQFGSEVNPKHEHLFFISRNNEFGILDFGALHVVNIRALFQSKLLFFSWWFTGSWFGDREVRWKCSLHFLQWHLNWKIIFFKKSKKFRMAAFLFQNIWDIAFYRFLPSAQFENETRTISEISNSSNSSLFLSQKIEKIEKKIFAHKQARIRLAENFGTIFFPF